MKQTPKEQREWIAWYLNKIIWSIEAAKPNEDVALWKMYRQAINSKKRIMRIVNKMN